MQKKAQVTTFIFLGLIIAILLLVTFYFFGESLLQKSTSQQLTQAQLLPLKEHIESCIQLSLDKNIAAIKRNAFFFSQSSYYAEYGGANINYLVYPDSAPNKLNTKEAVQDSLAAEIEKELQSCSLEQFKLDIKPDKSQMKAAATIAENKIIITLYYPIKVSKGSTSLQLQDFSTSKETDIGLIYNTIHDVIEGELQGEFDPVAYFQERRNVIINKNNLDARNAIYLVSSPQEQEYIMFAIKK